MSYLGQVLLESPTPDERIAEAVARSFGVGRVTVWPMSQVMDFDADIIVQREDQPGEFPVLIRLTAMPGAGLDDQLTEPDFIERARAIAATLDQFVLTDDAGVAPSDYEHFLLVAPTGKLLIVEADERALDDNRIELTAESRRRRAMLVEPAAITS